MAAKELLVPPEVYRQHAVHLGTRIKTKDMQKFIFRIRNDGLAILDISKIDERIRIAGRFLASYNPEDVVVVCRRESGRHAALTFCKVTGFRPIIGRYLPGTFTNPQYEYYMEPSVVVITDPWYDRQALEDAFKSGITVVALVDTNNTLSKIDLAIPCNNKSRKSLALVYYLLAKEVLRNRGEEANFTIEDFLPKQ